MTTLRSTECTDHLHDVAEQAGRVLDDLRSTVDAWSVPLDRDDPGVRDGFRTRLDSSRDGTRCPGVTTLASLHEGLETQMASLRRARASAEVLVGCSRNR